MIEERTAQDKQEILPRELPGSDSTYGKLAPFITVIKYPEGMSEELQGKLRYLFEINVERVINLVAGDEIIIDESTSNEVSQPSGTVGENIRKLKLRPAQVSAGYISVLVKDTKELVFADAVREYFKTFIANQEVTSVVNGIDIAIIVPNKSFTAPVHSVIIENMYTSNTGIIDVSTGNEDSEVKYEYRLNGTYLIGEQANAVALAVMQSLVPANSQ